MTLRYLLFTIILALGTEAKTQNYDNHFTRPLSQVLADVSRRFNVKFKLEVDTAGRQLPYADFRIRPYSLSETMTNICAAYDWKWYPNPITADVERTACDTSNNSHHATTVNIRIKSYDYPRRRIEEGQQMLNYLTALYTNRDEWETRARQLRSEVRTLLGIDAFLDSCNIGTPVLSKIRKHDGYSMQNICIALMPGLHVFGTIYAPLNSPSAASKGNKKSHPLIICPDGHWQPGRYREAEQLRLGTLARMGAVCVDFDLYGWGESAIEVTNHETARAHVYQAACGLVLLDAMLHQRNDIDTTRIGVCGGSGGGTHTILLSLLDSRIAAMAPVVHLASHFDGGCPCESGMPIQLAAGGTCEAELAATFAPRPLLIVSDGGDWTATVPAIELPFILRTYGFYGAANQVRNIHLPHERHDFEVNKRNAVYHFFADVFRLDTTRIDEQRITIEPAATMKSLYP